MTYRNYEKFSLDLLFEEDNKRELTFNKRDIYIIIDVLKYQGNKFHQCCECCTDHERETFKTVMFFDLSIARQYFATQI